MKPLVLKTIVLLAALPLLKQFFISWPSENANVTGQLTAVTTNYIKVKLPVSTTLLKCIDSKGNKILVKADAPGKGPLDGATVSDPDWQFSFDNGKTWQNHNEWLNVLANGRVTWQIKMHGTSEHPAKYVKMWLSTRTPGGAEHDGFIDLFDWDNKKFQLRLGDEVWEKPIVFTEIYY